MISFPLILQTITITQMMSTGGSGYMKVNSDAIQPLRSAAPSSLIVQRLSTVGHRAFPAVAACSWNNQPQHIISAPSLPVSGVRLKTYLFLLSMTVYSGHAVTRHIVTSIAHSLNYTAQRTRHTGSTIKHVLANISRSRHVAIATQPVPRLQICLIVHNYREASTTPQVTSGSMQ